MITDRFELNLKSPFLASVYILLAVFGIAMPRKQRKEIRVKTVDSVPVKPTPVLEEAVPVEVEAEVAVAAPITAPIAEALAETVVEEIEDATATAADTTAKRKAKGTRSSTRQKKVKVST